MQTPVEIDFQGMAATPKIRSAIADHMADLDQRLGRARERRLRRIHPRRQHGTAQPRVCPANHCVGATEKRRRNSEVEGR